MQNQVGDRTWEPHRGQSSWPSKTAGHVREVWQQAVGPAMPRMPSALCPMLVTAPMKWGLIFISQTLALIKGNEKWSISCHIGKQGCQSSAVLALLMWTTELSGRGRISAIQEPSAAATPYSEPRGAPGVKNRMPVPDSWAACARNNLGETRLLHLPIHRKALNSLVWDIWFLLINNNLLMFRLPALCCKISV